MTTMVVDLAAYTFSATEIANAIALKTTTEELRAVAIQSVRDASNALTNLDKCLVSAGANNKAAVEALIAALTP